MRGHAFYGEVAFLEEHRVREEAGAAGGAAGAQRQRGHGELRGNLEDRQQVRVGNEARDGVPGVLLQDGGEAVPQPGLARGAEREDLGDDVLDGGGRGAGRVLRSRYV